MNADRSSSTAPDDDAGDRLAKHVATSVASLIAIAIVAAGGRLWALSDADSERGARLVVVEREVVELHEYIEHINRRFDAYPGVAELGRCGQRLEALEQYRALDEHRMQQLEARR